MRRMPFSSHMARAGKLDSGEMFRHLVYCHLTFFDRYLKGKDVSFDGLPSDKVDYRRIG